MKNKGVKIIAIVLSAILIIVFVGAKIKRVNPLAWGHEAVNTPMFSDEAINGYDPVAYFTEGSAEKGEANFTFLWKDATWYFSSQTNLDLFKANPEKYAPQFGGYCAFAASKGFTANTDPTTFKVVDGKLYLCAEQKFLDEWIAGGEESRRLSEENWK
ncbi:MAG: YHS domain-containing (seleno)protein [Reichenbachiella sp.]|uniref:YHS domain-containing (seleno)protein n=1 Tax=Reichenbachiella sp. TaxID=2184521 RepID=UPI0032660C4C